mgnify:CR=1 FL=1
MKWCECLDDGTMTPEEIDNKKCRCCGGKLG